EAGLWYFFYFATERGRRGLEANRTEIARLIWERGSPEWAFDDATLARTAAAFDNDDYVEIVIHSYRHRLGLAPGDPSYENLEHALAALPPITVPAVTLDPQADGNFPATDGTASAVHFTGPRTHRQIPDAGHNLPPEQRAAPADYGRQAMAGAHRRARGHTPASPLLSLLAGGWHDSAASHRHRHDHPLGIDGQAAHGLGGLHAVVLYDRHKAAFDFTAKDHFGRLHRCRVRRRPLDQRYVAVKHPADDLAHIDAPSTKGP